MIKDREKGFAHLGIIAITLIVVAAVILAGWWVWSKSNDKKIDSNAPVSQSGDRSQVSTEDSQEKKEDTDSRLFNCKDTFTLNYPDSLLTTTTDAGQCLISNVTVNEMPSVGPLPPDQLGLFFNTQTAQNTTSKTYLDHLIESSQQDYPLQLKSQQEIQLNSGDAATLAQIYGGHPVEHDFYLFIYLKNGTAITTSYPTNSTHKERALEILKTIQ